LISISLGYNLFNKDLLYPPDFMLKAFIGQNELESLPFNPSLVIWIPRIKEFVRQLPQSSSQNSVSISIFKINMTSKPFRQVERLNTETNLKAEPLQCSM